MSDGKEREGERNNENYGRDFEEKRREIAKGKRVRGKTVSKRKRKSVRKHRKTVKRGIRLERRRQNNY